MLCAAPRSEVYSRPRPRRLPERKRMTIALGVICGDGLVISADTEETDGWLKTNQSKITVSQNIHLVTYEKGGGRAKVPETAATCAVAGAGNAGYIDALTPLLTGEVWKAKDETEYLKIF